MIDAKYKQKEQLDIILEKIKNSKEQTVEYENISKSNISELIKLGFIVEQTLLTTFYDYSHCNYTISW